MTQYLPESSSSREALAIKLLEGLTKAGFKSVDIPGCAEAVYERVGPHKSGRVTIRVHADAFLLGLGPGRAGHL